MADLLSRLIERTLGLAPLVQPTIPPMFAQGMASAWDDLQAAMTDAASPGSPQRVAAEPGPERPSAVSHPASTRVLRASPDEGAATPRQPLRQTSDPRPAPPQGVVSAISEHDDDTPSETTAGASRQSVSGPASRPPHPDDARSGVSSAEDTPVRLQPVEVKILSTRLRSAIAQPDLSSGAPSDRLELQPAPDPSSPVVSDVSGGQRAAIFPRRPSMPLPVRPQATPSLEPPQPSPTERRAADSESPPATPIIRVSIGRIDVRAVVLPAPPAPRPSPVRRGPALTLDDYLKQRSEGRR
jgi:hypothetical protein